MRGVLEGLEDLEEEKKEVEDFSIERTPDQSIDKECFPLVSISYVGRARFT